MTTPAGGARLAESTRVEAFSDGVFAIALTLLVLDLHSDATKGNFAHDLANQWQSYVAYLAAFLNISAVWLNHHDAFTRVRGVDVSLMGANLGLLLASSLLPFPAAVISSAWHDGGRSDQISACVLYGLIAVLVPITWTLLYRYLARSPRLLTSPADVAYMQDGQRRSTVTIAIYPAAAALAFITPIISLITFTAVPLFFIVTLIRSPHNVVPTGSATDSADASADA